MSSLPILVILCLLFESALNKPSRDVASGKLVTNVGSGETLVQLTDPDNSNGSYAYNFGEELLVHLLNKFYITSFVLLSPGSFPSGVVATLKSDLPGYSDCRTDSSAVRSGNTLLADFMEVTMFLGCFLNVVVVAGSRTTVGSVNECRTACSFSDKVALKVSYLITTANEFVTETEHGCHDPPPASFLKRITGTSCMSFCSENGYYFRHVDRGACFCGSYLPPDVRLLACKATDSETIRIHHVPPPSCSSSLPNSLCQGCSRDYIPPECLLKRCVTMVNRHCHYDNLGALGPVTSQPCQKSQILELGVCNPVNESQNYEIVNIAYRKVVLNLHTETVRILNFDFVPSFLGYITSFDNADFL
ncbi:hypothetical protein HELRODRAFT_168794 [Helobdella robusta]|uniref:WSC domain-containing protein n=1 Tax=Helobdella robusta TaxID=6412 RepID=T1F0Z3_HELRO|nr:hypothetical protein HELRODRAFT_168794 [Helobdella robusta]ESO08876.1 hypothetical protein HELRODRAFT_168794 [Helobdella robusta]